MDLVLNLQRPVKTSRTSSKSPSSDKKQNRAKLTFADFSGEVEVTNNECERDLRPAVLQRKVTNGFRSMSEAKGDCAVRTVVDTQKLKGKKPLPDNHGNNRLKISNCKG